MNFEHYYLHSTIILLNASAFPLMDPLELRPSLSDTAKCVCVYVCVCVCVCVCVPTITLEFAIPCKSGTCQ